VSNTLYCLTAVLLLSCHSVVAANPVMANTAGRLSGRLDPVADVTALVQSIDPSAKVRIEYHRAENPKAGGASIHQVQVACGSKDWRVEVHSSHPEWVSTLYFFVHKMGFLFPHPRTVIRPTVAKARAAVCGKTFQWKPSWPVRGFHLHTQHPSEWVAGFFQGQTKIAEEIILWSARNFQNVLQIQGLRTAKNEALSALRASHGVAQAFGVRLGLGVSLNSLQQRSWSLISLRCWIFRWCAAEELTKSMEPFRRGVIDILTLELGTSEFTSTDSERTLAAVEGVRDLLRPEGIELWTKIHVSTGQVDERFGNFNFLPGQSSPDVTVLPHTVHFYGLNDDTVPMYGRKDFSDMKEFLVGQVGRRPVVYFPETSYFIALDIDVPLFLTDYLVARAEDAKFIRAAGATGQLNFTTGQELGYWLFDWHVALQSVQEYVGDPLVTLRLLGEDLRLWQEHLNYQTKYFKKKQLIQMVTSTNLMDELPFFPKIHDRVTLRELFHRPDLLQSEIKVLTQAVGEFPSVEGIRTEELRWMLSTTRARLEHALSLRRYISEKNQQHLDRARALRLSVQPKLTAWNRYPDVPIFSRWSNPTSYQFGYGFPAAELWYWQREEDMVQARFWFPFYKNLWDPIALLF
jgi:hypothetical protein